METNLSFSYSLLFFGGISVWGNFHSQELQMDGYVLGNLLVFGVCLIRAVIRAVGYGGAVFVSELGFDRNVFTYAELSQFIDASGLPHAVHQGNVDILSALSGGAK